MSALCAQTVEQQALDISAQIPIKHLPHGSILNPVFSSPSSNDIVSYTRCGDSAIWTGHWLAAESYRYAVTRDPAALVAARQALAGIQMLVDVTGADNLLARCAFPDDSPYAAAIASEEASHGRYRATLNGQPYSWIGDTSRDQYIGAIFGLSVASEVVDDAQVRATASDLATRLIDRLLTKDWTVVMPDGSQSTTFILRPDQQLAILHVGMQLNAARFTQTYEDQWRGTAGFALPVTVDTLDTHNSYFKFNLDALTFFLLLHTPDSNSARHDEYMKAYRVFRDATLWHGNAHFNMMDRAINGADPRRDMETVVLMWQWLQRPRRDDWVDLRGKYKACGSDRACDVIPVPERVRTDFLWQRSPFLLFGGGQGTIETAGIDFILPYWMGRYYGIEYSLFVALSANGGLTLAPGAIGTVYGMNFLAGVVSVGSIALPYQLGGLRVDVGGTPAPLYFAAPGQVNFVVPQSVPTGTVPLVLTRPDGSRTTTSIGVQPVAPALYSADASGTGVAAAVAWTLDAGGQATLIPVFSCTADGCVTSPIGLPSQGPVYLSLFGTGVRNRSSLAAVHVSLGGKPLIVLYAGPQNQYPGLDQINVRLDQVLRGLGERDVTLSVDSVPANTLRLNVR